MTEYSVGEAFQKSLESVDSDRRVAALGAMLFVSNEPVPLQTLAHHLGCSLAEVRSAVDELELRLREIGLTLQRPSSDAIEIVTAPGLAPVLQRFLGLERTVRLSQAALEALAIIAYVQPVTRADVEAIRGVDSSGVLQTLVARELIEPVGRLETVGNPVQYGITPSFLRFFGIASLDELPPCPEELKAFALAKEDADEETR